MSAGKLRDRFECQFFRLNNVGCFSLFLSWLKDFRLQPCLFLSRTSSPIAPKRSFVWRRPVAIVGENRLGTLLANKKDDETAASRALDDSKKDERAALAAKYLLNAHR